MIILNTESYFVCILANKDRNLFGLYTTGNIIARLRELPANNVSGKSVMELVYWEQYGDAMEAIKREEQLRKHSIVKLIKLIKQKNPNLILIDEYVIKENEI